MKYPEYIELSLRNLSPAIVKAFKRILEKNLNCLAVNVSFGHQRNRGGYKYEKIGHSFGEYADNGDSYFSIKFKKL